MRAAAVARGDGANAFTREQWSSPQREFRTAYRPSVPRFPIPRFVNAHGGETTRRPPTISREPRLIVGADLLFRARTCHDGDGKRAAVCAEADGRVSVLRTMSSRSACKVMAAADPSEREHLANFAARRWSRARTPNNRVLHDTRSRRESGSQLARARTSRRQPSSGHSTHRRKTALHAAAKRGRGLVEHHDAGADAPYGDRLSDVSQAVSGGRREAAARVIGKRSSRAYKCAASRTTRPSIRHPRTPGRGDLLRARVRQPQKRGARRAADGGRSAATRAGGRPPARDRFAC